MSTTCDDPDPSSHQDEEVFGPRISHPRFSHVNDRKRSLVSDSTSEDNVDEIAHDLKKQKVHSGHVRRNWNISEIMQAIHVSCSSIEESISKESNHKIQFNKEDRDVVRTSISNILKDCNLILAVAVEALDKCTSLQKTCLDNEAKMSGAKQDFYGMTMEYERQIATLTDKLHVAETKRDKIQPSQRPIPAKRTRYASIVALNSSDEEGRGFLQEEDGWKKVARKVTKMVQKTVDINETGALRNKINLKSGKVILESNTKAQSKAVRNALTGVPGIRVKELTNQDPIVILTGIEKGYDETQIIDEIYAQNERIRARMGSVQDWKGSIKFLTKKDCRNKDKENWTFQVSPRLFALLDREGKVVLDLVEVMVEERIRVSMCYRCCAFGHVAKYCRALKPICSECGEEGHERKECVASVKKCPNCYRFIGKKLEHAATDNLCPCVIKKKEQSKARVNYNG